MVDFAVMHLKALFGCEGGLAAFLLAVERLGPQMNEHMLLEVGLLRELFAAVHTDVFLLLLVNFANVSVERIFGAENELTLDTVKLS